MREPRSFAKAAMDSEKSRSRFASCPFPPPSAACVSQPPTSVKATSRPTSAWMSWAIWRSALPRGPRGYSAPLEGAMRAGSVERTMCTASKDSCAVACSVPATALSYIASKDWETGSEDAPARIPNSERLVIAIAAEPARMRGMPGDIATARSGDAFGAADWRSARARNPSEVDLTPGVPDSMKSCASKCERVASGLPTACTNAAERSRKNGRRGAIEGWIPKKPSRSSAAFSPEPGLATAIVGRAS